MAAFPNVKFTWRDLSETPESVLERTEMERGIPKQRRKASDAQVTLELTLIFDTKVQVADFEDWFYEDIRAGADWFDFAHPRTGATVQARVVGGAIGALKYDQPTLEASNRSLQIEYWRAAW